MLKQQIESLLFVSIKPLSAREIFNFLKKHEVATSEEEVKTNLAELFNEYHEGHGLTLIESDGQYQFVSSVDNAELIKKFLKDERTGELTQPSLEALTVIAYRGPITKPILEQIRGVNCTMIIRNLLIRGLVIEEARGEETVYNVTPEFLKYLGLNSVKDLPDYEKLNTVENLEQFLAARQSEQPATGL